jgi:hypothetical protein
MQFRKYGNQFDRQIVHAIEAHILESVEHRTLSGAGEARQDYQLPAGVSRFIFTAMGR